MAGLDLQKDEHVSQNLREKLGKNKKEFER